MSMDRLQEFPLAFLTGSSPALFYQPMETLNRDWINTHFPIRLVQNGGAGFIMPVARGRGDCRARMQPLSVDSRNL